MFSTSVPMDPAGPSEPPRSRAPESEGLNHTVQEFIRDYMHTFNIINEYNQLMRGREGRGDRDKKNCFALKRKNR